MAASMQTAMLTTTRKPKNCTGRKFENPRIAKPSTTASALNTMPRPTVVSAISAACSAAGYWLITVLPAADGHLVEAFAAGAMLTMLAGAMMPEAYEHGGRAVGLLTVLGFLAAAALSALE